MWMRGPQGEGRIQWSRALNFLYAYENEMKKNLNGENKQTNKHTDMVLITTNSLWKTEAMQGLCIFHFGENNKGTSLESILAQY